MQVLEFFHKYKWYVIGIVMLLAISFSLYIYSSKESEGNDFKSIEQVSGSSDKKGREDTPCNLFVDVSGSVNNPNVYCFEQGSLVIDALKRAGGYVKGKNAYEYIRANINLARPLVANEKIYFPYRNEIKYTQMKYVLIPVKSVNDEIPSEKKCISLNEATSEQLDSLSGVGPSTISKIVDNRPYKKVEDLKNVSGISEVLFEKIKNEICL